MITLIGKFLGVTALGIALIGSMSQSQAASILDRDLNQLWRLTEPLLDISILRNTNECGDAFMFAAKAFPLNDDSITPQAHPSIILFQNKVQKSLTLNYSRLNHSNSTSMDRLTEALLPPQSMISKTVTRTSELPTVLPFTVIESHSGLAVEALLEDSFDGSETLKKFHVKTAAITQTMAGQILRIARFARMLPPHWTYEIEVSSVGNSTFKSEGPMSRTEFHRLVQMIRKTPTNTRNETLELYFSFHSPDGNSVFSTTGFENDQIEHTGWNTSVLASQSVNPIVSRWISEQIADLPSLSDQSPTVALGLWTHMVQFLKPALEKADTQQFRRNFPPPLLSWDEVLFLKALEEDDLNTHF